MKKHLPTIGILGGMGPSASVDFYRRLVDLAQREYNAEQDTDFPPLHLYSLPLEGFDETGLVDPEGVRAQLVAGVQKLESVGSDFIVVPCNTVHVFYEDMCSAVSIPVISIVSSVVEAALGRGLVTVALLSSESTRESQLYEEAFASQGIRALPVTPDEQRVLTTVIYHVMAGIQGEADIVALRTIINHLVSEGAEAVALGCTELPLAITQEEVPVPLLSSTEVLARAALARVYS